MKMNFYFWIVLKWGCLHLQRILLEVHVEKHALKTSAVINSNDIMIFGQMRFLIIILTTATTIAFGQSTKMAMDCEKVLDTLTHKEIYNTVDTQASVIGGLSKIYAELGAINIPKDPDINQIRIFISFIVEPNGDITGLQTIGKMQNTTFDNELLQLFKKYKWEPGTCKGVKVPTRLVYKVTS